MNINPYLADGLSIRMDSEADWMMLEMICSDAGCPSKLAASFAGLMGESGGDWEDYVVPDLQKSFNGQCRHVARVIEETRESRKSTIFIGTDQAEYWYGALNQARLALQERYKLSAIKSFDDVPLEISSAHFRDRFYSGLQEMLIACVMDDC